MAFYKRSIFLINPKFQLGFSLIVCSIIFVSSLLYPLFMMDFFNELKNIYPDMAEGLEQSKSQIIMLLAVIQIVFNLLVFVIFIFLTHKIAGPMHKLKMHLSQIREGAAITPLAFRDGDHFQDVAEEVSLFLDTIALNQESDFQYVEEISTYINNLATVVPDDKKPVLNEISRRLLEIKSRYKNDL